MGLTFLGWVKFKIYFWKIILSDKKARPRRPPKLRGFACACNPAVARFKTQAHQLIFFQFVLLKLKWERSKINKKEAEIGALLICRDWPIFKRLGHGLLCFRTEYCEQKNVVSAYFSLLPRPLYFDLNDCSFEGIHRCLLGWSMELFSRGRWRLVSAQLSIKFGHNPWCAVSIVSIN